jgi:hypothetical protein
MRAAAARAYRHSLCAGIGSPSGCHAGRHSQLSAPSVQSGTHRRCVRPLRQSWGAAGPTQVSVRAMPPHCCPYTAIVSRTPQVQVQACSRLSGDRACVMPVAGGGRRTVFAAVLRDKEWLKRCKQAQLVCDQQHVDLKAGIDQMRNSQGPEQSESRVHDKKHEAGPRERHLYGGE